MSKHKTPSRFYRFPRNARAIPCGCGGMAHRVQCNKEEIKMFNCGLFTECCARAFVCHTCGHRLAGGADFD